MLIGIESRRDEHKIGPKREKRLPRLPQKGHMALGRSIRKNRVIEAIPVTYGSRAGVAGILVDGDKRDALASANDGLGAIPVMRIEVPDRDSCDAAGTSDERRDRDVIEVAKPHRPVGRGVMPGRAHEAECRAPRTSFLNRRQRRSSRKRGMLGDAFIMWRVAIERSRLLQSFQVPGRVGAE